MKSLRYVLGGRPHTIDDCLDLACSQLPDKIILKATTEDSIREIHILRQFVGTYQWQFADCRISCSEVYGCVFLPAREQEQKSSLAAANAKLQRRLQEIQQCTIEVGGADRRSEDSEYLCART